jgi:hypothetical protein
MVRRVRPAGSPAGFPRGKGEPWARILRVRSPVVKRVAARPVFAAVSGVRAGSCLAVLGKPSSIRPRTLPGARRFAPPGGSDRQRAGAGPGGTSKSAFWRFSDSVRARGEYHDAINGHTFGEFTLAVSPADHDVSGVKVLRVIDESWPIERILGRHTTRIAAAAPECTPDDAWTRGGQPPGSKRSGRQGGRGVHENEVESAACGGARDALHRGRGATWFPGAGRGEPGDPWDDRYGDYGGHTDTTTPAFVEHVIAPILMCEGPRYVRVHAEGPARTYPGAAR